MIYLHTFVVGGLILGVGAVLPAATLTPQPTKFLAGNHWALLLALPTAPIQHHQPSALTKKICWDQAPIHRPLEKPQELKVHVKHRKKWGTEKYWMQLTEVQLWLIYGDSTILQRGGRRWGEACQAQRKRRQQQRSETRVRHTKWQLNVKSDRYFLQER